MFQVVSQHLYRRGRWPCGFLSRFLQVLISLSLSAFALHANDGSQSIIAHGTEESGKPSVSPLLFASLERASRLVDITYCVGNSGISPPFSCVSRCQDFPSLELVATWNTGLLMTDSCGYIAVDDGSDDSSLTGTALPSIFGPAIIVAFRGTYSITNTIIDLSTVPQEYVPYPAPDGDGKSTPGEKCDNCTVHRGFLMSWESARETVLPALKAAHTRHPTYPIHIMGHSLGGAVAALAALDVKLTLGWADVKVTTFGEPRVGNDGLVAYIDKAFGLDKEDGSQPGQEERSYRRVTHVNDPVPLLPPAKWGYRAHAGELFISKLDLPPGLEDIRICKGDKDDRCSTGTDGTSEVVTRRLEQHDWDGSQLQQVPLPKMKVGGLPTSLMLWELLFAHRDYFWRLGLCVPGGDPIDWRRDRYNISGLVS